MENSLKKHLTEWAGVVPQWFALIAAMMYASGFLCVSTFLDRFGIYETGEDFLRVKYIHIGILFLLFPVSILLPLLLSLSIKKIAPQGNSEDKAQPDGPTVVAKPEGQKHHKWADRIHVSSILIFMNMCAVFYIFILLTPRDFALKRVYMFPLIFLVSLVGPLVTDNFVKNNIVPHRTEIYARSLRWCLVIVVVAVLDYYAFRGFFKRLWDIVWGSGWIPDGAIYYAIFIVLIPFIIWRTNVRCKRIEHSRAKLEMRLAAFCLGGMFYLLSVIAFALTVYPQIPVAKGGGNYSECPCVKIDFRPVPGVSPIVDVVTPLEKELSRSNNFVMIEQTPSSFFLARTNEAGGPMAWLKMRNLPNIVEVRRDAVDTIVYTQVNDSD